MTPVQYMKNYKVDSFRLNVASSQEPKLLNCNQVNF